MGCRIVHKLYFNNSSSVLTYRLVVALSASAVNLVDGKQRGERTGGTGSQAPAPAPLIALLKHDMSYNSKLNAKPFDGAPILQLLWRARERERQSSG